jgi:Icc-related predicted phosphoesterase
VIRVAAVGDIHVGAEGEDPWGGWLDKIEEEADILLLAGDLTRSGSAIEAGHLAASLRSVRIPVVAVLGNHDYHCDQVEEITRLLADAGVRVLECTSTVVEVGGAQIGVAGTKGFGGGFTGACGTDFGEPEMKAFIRLTQRLALELRRDLERLETDFRIALLHYSPVPMTLEGEKREIFPFLGSYLLAEAVDGIGVDLVIHGHAHGGRECGVTPGGTPVRNVARHVICQPYKIYTFERSALRAPSPVAAQDLSAVSAPAPKHAAR